MKFAIMRCISLFSSITVLFFGGCASNMNRDVVFSKKIRAVIKLVHPGMGFEEVDAVMKESKFDDIGYNPETLRYGGLDIMNRGLIVSRDERIFIQFGSDSKVTDILFEPVFTGP